MEPITFLLSILAFTTSTISHPLIPTGNKTTIPLGCPNESPLHQAVRSGKLKTLLEVLKSPSTRLYDTNCRGLTPVHLAILADNGDMLTAFIEHKVDVKRTFNGGNTLLHYAARTGAVESARILVGFGCPIDSLNDSGLTPLAEAVKRNDVDLVNRLVRAGADKEWTSRFGESYAEFAVSHRAGGALSALLDIGLPTEDYMPNHVSPMRLAVIRNDVDSLNALYNHHAKMNLRSDTGNMTLLHEAVYLGHFKATSWLLEAGADAQAKDGYGRTPLHTAAWRGLYGIGKLILSYNVDINVPDSRGWTPLHYATERGHQDMVNLLVERGGRDFSGMHPGEERIFFKPQYDF